MMSPPTASPERDVDPQGCAALVETLPGRNTMDRARETHP